MVKRRGIVKEFFDLIWTKKAFWMAPIVFVLLLFIMLITFGGTAAAPFIYTLF